MPRINHMTSNGGRVMEPHGLAYIMAMTCGIGGLQIIWALVFANGTPYLMSLGLSKAFTSLTWLSAPICGMLFQPLVGLASDNYQGRLGRRRPFVMVGTIGVITTILLLAWIQPIWGGFGRLFQIEHETALRPVIQVSSILLVCLLNVSVQPVQMGLRALIAENSHASEQPRASFWASYWIALGNIVGYGSAFLGLPRMLSVSSLITRFQSLCVLSALILGATVCITCLSVREVDFSQPLPIERKRKAVWKPWSSLEKNYRHMTLPVQRICKIQFWAWMAWFPFLYYGSTYIMETFLQGGAVQQTLTQQSAPIGALGFLFCSVSSLMMNTFIPYMLRVRAPRGGEQRKHVLATIWALSFIFLPVCIAMTFFITTWRHAIIYTTYVGLPWALTQSAPFALVGEECSQGEDNMGAVMGLHNVAISAPQLLSGLLCAILFYVLSRLGVRNETAWVLRATAIPALAAGWCAWELAARYKENDGLDREEEPPAMRNCLEC